MAECAACDQFANELIDKLRSAANDIKFIGPRGGMSNLGFGEHQGLNRAAGIVCEMTFGHDFPTDVSEFDKVVGNIHCKRCGTMQPRGLIGASE